MEEEIKYFIKFWRKYRENPKEIHSDILIAYTCPFKCCTASVDLDALCEVLEQLVE